MGLIQHTCQYGRSYNRELCFTPSCLKGFSLPPSLLLNLNQNWYFKAHANCSFAMTLLGSMHFSNCTLKWPFILVDLYGCPTASHLHVLMWVFLPSSTKCSPLELGPQMGHAQYP